MNMKRISTLLFSAGLLAASTAMAAPSDISNLTTRLAEFKPGQSMETLRQIEAKIRQSSEDPDQRINIEEQLCKILISPSTFTAKRFACKQLGIIGSDASIPALEELLKNPDTTGIACLALSTHPSSQANRILRQALDELKNNARIQVINTLGDREDGASTGLLEDLAHNADPETAEAAVIALGKIGDSKARRVVESLYNAPQNTLKPALNEARLRIAERLAKTGQASKAARIYESFLSTDHPAHLRRGALSALLKLDADSGVARIKKVLKGNDADLIPVAIAAIAELPAPQTSGEFAAFLPNLDTAHRVHLIQALAVRNDAGARAAISRELQAEELPVRLAAIKALGRIGGATVASPLCRSLAKAEIPAEQQAVEKALITLKGGLKTDQAIIQVLNNASVQERIMLIRILADRQSREAFDTILAHTDHDAPAVKQAAFKALAKLANGGDFQELLAQLVKLSSNIARGDAENAVIKALRQNQDKNACAQKIYQQLQQAGDIDTHCSLLRLLPHVATTDALSRLKTACNDPNEKVRDTAVRTLISWPSMSAWDSLADIYRNPKNETHRVLTLRAMVQLADNAGTQTADAEMLTGKYRFLLSHAKNNADRRMILGPLANVADPAALKLALPLLDNSEIRQEAELAVRKISEAIKEQHPATAENALELLK